MIPIDYIEGLETCYLTELLIPGEDEEATEDIRARYFDTFDTKPFGGNRRTIFRRQMHFLVLEAPKSHLPGMAVELFF